MTRRRRTEGAGVVGRSAGPAGSVGPLLDVEDIAAVDGLAEVHCKTAAQLLQAFDSGRRHLRYAETKLNKSSSRSHAVLQLSVSRRLRVLDANEARA